MRPCSAHESQIVRHVYCALSHLLVRILLVCTALHHSSGLNAEATLFSVGQPGARRDLNLGPIDRSHDLVTALSSQAEPSFRVDRLSSVTLLRTENQQQQRRATGIGSNEAAGGRPTSGKGQEDAMVADCLTKRNEVIKRQSQTGSSGRAGSPSSTVSPAAGFHRLKPKVDSNGTGAPPVVLNVTLANNLDGEHIPRCRLDGSYDPVQCHKIGYCWCVNRYGQAIKNSAFRLGEEPECNPSMYDSESNNQLVVAGISAQRMRSLLKAGSAFDTSTPNGHINFEATEPTTSTLGPHEAPLVGSLQQVERHNVAAVTASQRPILPLIPNDCKSSRENAQTRAAANVNDSIWVPECDSNDGKLYAEQQCHRSRVCWCVDQASGLPLRTSEQLSSRATDHNCTEIKRILGLTSTKPLMAPDAQRQGQQQEAFYQGSSEYCDADKRADFVVSLNTQFRLQIGEYLRQNPTSALPTDLSSSNPFQISESQVARWKFNIMDRDLDGKIGDREWSKFKNNFKLVERVAELDVPLKQQKSPYFALAPLLIVRSQRKCWRDFLEFCGNGELLDESVSLTMWMRCTEVPSRSTRDEHAVRNSASTADNTYALSREAAVVRSQKKNPFLGILKPD